MGRLSGVAAEELAMLRPRVVLARTLGSVLPPGAFCRVRARLLRLVGFEVARSATLFDVPSIHGTRGVHRRLRVEGSTMINVGCRFDVSDHVTISEGASLGQDVLILTSSHRIGESSGRAAELIAAPVVVGAGAWIGARAVIMPGVTVGRGAVVAAGSVVLADVEPDTLVAGVPAVAKKQLEPTTRHRRCPSSF